MVGLSVVTLTSRRRLCRVLRADSFHNRRSSSPDATTVCSRILCHPLSEVLSNVPRAFSDDLCGFFFFLSDLMDFACIKVNKKSRS